MAKRTDNSIIINAPLERVWEITNDVENWPALFTEYAKAEILSREGNTVRFRLTMHPDQKGNKWNWVSERTTYPETRTVKAHRIEKGWFKFMHIEWYYEPAEGGTKMRWVQEFEMDPAISPVTDDQMENNINTNTKTQMSIIKQRVEQRVGQGS